MRFIQPSRDDTSIPIGVKYCIPDSNTLISYDDYTAYYYVKVSASQADWIYSRNYRYRVNSYDSNPCYSYISYSVSQQYTPLDFSANLITNGIVTYALITLPIISIIGFSRLWKLYRHRF